MTVQLSDPRPSFCSACHNHPDSRYVDLEAAFDAGNFIDAETGVYIEGSDDLHLCESCVKLAASVLDFKPDLHARQLREISRLQKAAEHWQNYAKDLERTVSERPDPFDSAPRPPRRKVAA